MMCNVQGFRGLFNSKIPTLEQFEIRSRLVPREAELGLESVGNLLTVESSLGERPWRWQNSSPETECPRRKSGVKSLTSDSPRGPGAQAFGQYEEEKEHPQYQRGKLVGFRPA